MALAKQADTLHVARGSTFTSQRTVQEILVCLHDMVAMGHKYFTMFQAIRGGIHTDSDTETVGIALSPDGTRFILAFSVVDTSLSLQEMMACLLSRDRGMYRYICRQLIDR